MVRYISYCNTCQAWHTLQTNRKRSVCPQVSPGFQVCDACPPRGSNRPTYGQLAAVQKQWTATVSHQSRRLCGEWRGCSALVARRRKMQKTFFYLAVLFAMSLFAGEFLAQTAPPQTGPKSTSICALQKNVAEGEHQTVRVSGVYG